jgi:hypothetical protein
LSPDRKKALFHEEFFTHTVETFKEDIFIFIEEVVPELIPLRPDIFLPQRNKTDLV